MTSHQERAREAFGCTRHKSNGNYTCPFCASRVKRIALALTRLEEETIEKAIKSAEGIKPQRFYEFDDFNNNGYLKAIIKAIRTLKPNVEGK